MVKAAAEKRRIVKDRKTEEAASRRSRLVTDGGTIPEIVREGDECGKSSC